MANSTSRLALVQPVGTDAASELRTSITANATTLDASVIVTEGALADRPAGSYVGQTYYATDTGLWYFYTGAAWQAVTFGATAPVGTVQQFAGATITADPDGVTRWHVCDGSALSRTTYSSLFAALSTTWGAGDGSTTFNIPDLRGRVPVGSGAGSGLTSRTLAQEGGAETHDHSVPGLSVPGLSVPSAGVTVNAHSHTLGAGYAGMGLTNSVLYWAPAAGTVPIQWSVFATGWQKDSASGDETYGSQLYGSTDADGASGSTAATTTGTGTTGTGTTGNGSTMPPFAVVTHIIKIL